MSAPTGGPTAIPPPSSDGLGLTPNQADHQHQGISFAPQPSLPLPLSQPYHYAPAPGPTTPPPQHQHSALGSTLPEAMDSDSPAGAGSISAGAGAGAAGSAVQFTPKMRDRQSRGKNPYAADDNSDVDEEFEWRCKYPEGLALAAPANPDERLRRTQGSMRKGDFAAMERRQQAIAYLDNPEMLMMHAQSTGDSIPATRLHFMKMMCGYDDDSLEEARRGAARPRKKALLQRQSASPSQADSPLPQPERDPNARRGGDRAAGR